MIQPFKKAGCKNVKLERIGPEWYPCVFRHGIHMSCPVTGDERLSGDSPLQAEYMGKPINSFVFLLLVILGTIAAMFSIVPIYMWLKPQGSNCSKRDANMKGGESDYLKSLSQDLSRLLFWYVSVN
ncbi:hypothetical protein Leryth_005789 [Lithospermum erythrorhizon]|uniref:Uncharacterized protein n=1 Tax=Lithospermum erythrorhizon TaxID=34254 RepID=A0AAV3QJ42_LITER|nr:hypothetical protein Leryth_005789 [Lithospermum erythrorhizon]